eukprot:jgi/Bigna1/82072/fgenesh1_pg.87_\
MDLPLISMCSNDTHRHNLLDFLFQDDHFPFSAQTHLPMISMCSNCTFRRFGSGLSSMVQETPTFESNNFNLSQDSDSEASYEIFATNGDAMFNSPKSEHLQALLDDQTLKPSTTRNQCARSNADDDTSISIVNDISDSCKGTRSLASLSSVTCTAAHCERRAIWSSFKILKPEIYYSEETKALRELSTGLFALHNLEESSRSSIVTVRGTKLGYACQLKCGKHLSCTKRRRRKHGQLKRGPDGRNVRKHWASCSNMPHSMKSLTRILREHIASMSKKQKKSEDVVLNGSHYQKLSEEAKQISEYYSALSAACSALAIEANYVTGDIKEKLNNSNA